MVRRSTWILLVVFVLLVAITWWLQRDQAGEAEPSATSVPTTAKARIFDFDTTQVQEISISSSDGSQIGLYRDPATSQWAVVDQPVEQADTFQIEAVVGQLLGLEIKETLPGNPDLDPIGLETPLYTIDLATLDGDQYTLHVGTLTPVSSGYYARLKSGQVVIVDNMVMDNVIGLLTNPPLLPTATPETTATDQAETTETVPAVTPTP